MKRGTQILVGAGMIIGAIVVAFLIALFLLLYTDAGYRLELIVIKAKLRKIPNISVLQVWGRTQDLSLEDKFARVDVKGKGLLTLIDLADDSFDDVRNLRLLEIGDIGFVRQGGDGALADWVDIGLDGDVAEFQALGITNFQSAVARYDDIKRIVADWPRDPEKIQLKNAAGMPCSFSVKGRSRKAE